MKKILPYVIALIIGFLAGWMVTIHTEIPFVEPETKHIMIVDVFGMVWEYTVL